MRTTGDCSAVSSDENLLDVVAIEVSAAVVRPGAQWYAKRSFSTKPQLATLRYTGLGTG